MNDIIVWAGQQVNGILSTSPGVLLLVGLIGLGLLLKKTPRIRDWCIPWILILISGAAGPFILDLSKAVADARFPWAQRLLYSFAIGAAAVGGHQVVKQFRGRKADALADDKTPPPTNKP